MSGSPSEAEIQTQWRNAVDVLEDLRAHIDGTVVGASGQFDLLLQSLEGEYTPVGIATAAQRMRASLSSLVEPRRVLEFLEPVLFEYARLMQVPETSTGEIMRRLYERFVANSLTVESRNITFDTTATAGVGNTGNGAVARLTLDENNFAIESCTVETKTLRCTQDQNTGTEEWAEVFEVRGGAPSADALLRSSSGSGARVQLIAAHAGSGNGGSLLRNSSFSTYSATASPKFSGWTETAGGAQITQQTSDFYRSAPGSTVDASLRINGGGGTVTLTQALEDMRISRLEPNQPYFLRVMVNKTVGTAVGGNVVVRMGSVTVTTSIASLGSGWQEILVPLDRSCWPRYFGQNPFTIQIEWASSTSGYLLVDDVLFVPFTRVDGTWWLVRHNGASPAAWAVDDTLEFTDTGGAPATAKIQWWLWVAGLGYLPSTTGTPTFTEP